MGDRISMRNRYDYRYGIWGIDLGYGISIWLSTISIWSSWISIWLWANDMGDDSIDMVILLIDMGHLVSLMDSARHVTGWHRHSRNERAHSYAMTWEHYPAVPTLGAPISRSTTSRCPCRAAVINGVAPSLLRALLTFTPGVSGAS